MDKILEALLKIIPFAQLFEKMGINKELSFGLATLIDVALLYILWSLYKYVIKLYNIKKEAIDQMKRFFDYKKVKASRDLFIQTQGQNASPTYEEEPSFTNRFVVRKALIPFFLKTAFNVKKETEKFYLILADSGMGKTTFMINLFIRNYSFLNLRYKYKMRLYPFGDSRILDFIKQIKPEEANNTILLLDAFDEDKKLIPLDEHDDLNDEERFRKRLDEVIEAVRDFREVIITSRTQYFPGQEKQPYELKIPRFDDAGLHKLAKLYLSPFDLNEIKRYLNKKYGIIRFWNRKKKKNAYRIVISSPKLMVRPMLLSYIDFLVESNKTFQNTYEIYETLVNKWIERESIKRKQIQDRENFKIDLYKYSQLVANEIYIQRKESEMLFLNKESAIKVAKKNNIDLQDYEITGQSLLTRDAEGNWKFAHKSILEFFIAREAINNKAFLKTINFAEMDMARQFFLEAILADNFVSIKGGTFLMGSPPNEFGRKESETQGSVTISDFFICKYLITQDIYEKMTGMNPSYLGNNGKLPVENVSWFDAITFCNIINKKAGFSVTYDESGNLLNEMGHFTSDIKKVRGYRLPTEAEWEYACRAGAQTSYNTGDVLMPQHANFGNGNKGKTKEVGSYPPNVWGLYDMHGNVWEWCNDWYAAYPKEERVNPTGSVTGECRVVRGGSFFDLGKNNRCATRQGFDPVERSRIVGFRLVLTPF